MTQQEIRDTIKEIGACRFKYRIILQKEDCWFLYNINERIQQAEIITPKQEKYLLLILYLVRENKYTKKERLKHQ
jgi:hypothetical protein